MEFNTYNITAGQIHVPYIFLPGSILCVKISGNKTLSVVRSQNEISFKNSHHTLMFLSNFSLASQKFKFVARVCHNLFWSKSLLFNCDQSLKKFIMFEEGYNI